MTCTLTGSAQDKVYTPKNGVFSWKAIVLGGGFRITIAVPLHGDFSKYDRVEIVRSESLIGPDVPAAFLVRLTDQLTAEFKKGQRFTDVTVIDSYEPKAFPVDDAVGTAGETFRDADSLEAPMRNAGDLLAFDREREAAATIAPASSTLVVSSEVIDYAKGNKLAQLLFLDLGNAVVTMRFSYHDKGTGEELGRSVISSDNSSKVVPSVLSPRTALSGVAEGLVDQVTRRKVAGER